jgi:hypothetical protein
MNPRLTDPKDTAMTTERPDRTTDLTGDDRKEGVTAGYDPVNDTWHVEIHRREQPVEIIRIWSPQVPDEDTARTLAQQIAEHRAYRHIEANTNLTPSADLVTQIRVAADVPGDDDPALLERITRLAESEQQAHDAGWTRVSQLPEAVGEAADGVQYEPVNGVMVVAVSGTVGIGGIIPATIDPQDARAIGAALIAAAKKAEDLRGPLGPRVDTAPRESETW